MQTLAVVLRQPHQLDRERLELTAPGSADVVVETEWTGISAGTERLLWSGAMPAFPGMGYPLVPGYETVGRVVEVGPESGRAVGERVFVPGARCYGEVRGLFGGAASRLVTGGARVAPLPETVGEDGTLLALAATAHHALAGADPDGPLLIVGHGALGRLIARLAVTFGRAPVVWEAKPERRAGGLGYEAIDAADDDRRDYRTIVDVSGDGALLDRLIGRLARGGEAVLAGFYADRLSFAFPPAFLREARLRVAAEWGPADLAAVRGLVADGGLDLAGLITHREPATRAAYAYRAAFNDPQCLKMTLDWRA